MSIRLTPEEEAIIEATKKQGETEAGQRQPKRSDRYRPMLSMLMIIAFLLVLILFVFIILRALS